MNTDIRIQISFSHHVKRRKLQARLKSDGVLALLDLWLYAGENHPDGTLRGMNEEDIALAAAWKGKPKTFIDALLDIGFLDYSQERYILHDWEDHNPYAVHAPERKERAKAAAKHRWGMRVACGEHAGSMPVDMLNDENRNAPSPTPSPDPIPAPSPDPLKAEAPVDNFNDDPPPFPEPEPKKAASKENGQEKQEMKEAVNEIIIRYPAFAVATWIGKHLNDNPDAVLHSLKALLKLKTEALETTPWAFCEAVLTGGKKNGGELAKYNARESEQKHTRIKQAERGNVVSVANILASVMPKGVMP